MKREIGGKRLCEVEKNIETREKGDEGAVFRRDNPV